MELALKCKMGRAGKTSNRFLSFSPYILFTFLFALSLCASGALAREETVKAFLIPHSHCDPGWLETYEVPLLHPISLQKCWPIYILKKWV